MTKKPAATSRPPRAPKATRRPIGRWVYCPASNILHSGWQPCEVLKKDAYFYVCSCGARGFLPGWDDSLGYTITDIEAAGLKADVSAVRRAELLAEVERFKRRVNGRQA